MLPSWANDTITVLHPAQTTSRGSTVPDWTNATATTVKGCSVQPAGTTLDQNGRVLGITDGLTAYLPSTATVEAGDRIVFNGETYTIEGEPRRWNSATGRVSSILLNLKRWAG